MNSKAISASRRKLREKLSRIGVSETELIVLLSGCSERLLIEMIANCREIEMIIKLSAGDWS